MYWPSFLSRPVTSPFCCGVMVAFVFLAATTVPATNALPHPYSCVLKGRRFESGRSIFVRFQGRCQESKCVCRFGRVYCKHGCPYTLVCQDWQIHLNDSCGCPTRCAIKPPEAPTELPTTQNWIKSAYNPDDSDLFALQRLDAEPTHRSLTKNGFSAPKPQRQSLRRKKKQRGKGHKFLLRNKTAKKAKNRQKGRRCKTNGRARSNGVHRTFNSFNLRNMLD